MQSRYIAITEPSAVGDTAANVILEQRGIYANAKLYWEHGSYQSLVPRRNEADSSGRVALMGC